MLVLDQSSNGNQLALYHQKDAWQHDVTSKSGAEWLYEKSAEAWNALCAFVRSIFCQIGQLFASFSRSAEDESAANFASSVPPEGFIESKSWCMPATAGPILSKTPDGEFLLFKKAPKIRNMVLQGGGAKGLTYPTFVKVLNEGTAILKGLKEIAGSSAGSMLAFLLATGVSPDEAEKHLNANDLSTQMAGDAPAGLELGMGYYTAGNITTLLGNIARESASTYFNEVHTKAHKLQKIQDKEGFEQFMERGKQGFATGVTFKDLEFLHGLKPKKFKLFHATGFDCATKQTIYFNSTTYPDLGCHLAVRASIAIPFLIKSVYINGREISDGGEGSNTPIEIFSQREGYKAAETVALVFNRKGNGNATLHQPVRNGWHGRGLGWVMTILSYLFAHHYPANRKADAEKIYELGPNVFIVPHDGLKTKSFDATKEQIASAALVAAESARQYAALRHSAAVVERYSTEAEALATLTEKERQMLEYTT